MVLATFSTISNYVLDAHAYVLSQDATANTSRIYWRINVVKSGTVGHKATVGSGSWGKANGGSGNLVPDLRIDDLWDKPDLSFDFQNGSDNGTFLMAEGHFNVKHRNDGNGEFFLNVEMNLAAIGYAKAGTGWVSVPRLSSVPEAPSGISLDQVTPTSMRYTFFMNGDGGRPILEWQARYQRDPDGSHVYIEWSGGVEVVTNLKPGTHYNFWARGRNAVGWGPWSLPISERTTSAVRIKKSGVWKEAIPYVKVDGEWKIVEPYLIVNGIWKKTV